MPFWKSLFAATTLLAFCACHQETPKAASQRWDLTSAEHSSAWQAAGIPDEGKVESQQGQLTLEAGRPMTGATFSSWQALGLPTTNYQITYEAMRVDGGDFFGTITFPVGNLKTHVSLVLGGWGGTLIGISSIDYSDASENQTRSEQRFEQGRWYRVRLEIRPEELKAWIDDKIVVNVNIKARRLGLRAGEIERCRPFGFASYLATARIRRVMIEKLD